MTDTAPPATPAPVPAPAPAVAAPTAAQAPPGKGSRRGAIVVLVLIIFSLTWYFVTDRLAPHSSQARIEAFVIPVPAEVSGTVLKVYVRNNDEVKPGQPLFDIDPSQYRIALARARSDYETVKSSVAASNAAVTAAQASVQSATAHYVYAKQDAARMEQIYAEDPGAVSVRRVQQTQASRVQAEGRVKGAEADLRRAQENAGEAGEKNAQLISARAAVEKAELDVRRTVVVAPARGSVTDLRTDVGRFAQTGAAAMTLIAMHDLWIKADMTENNLGNVVPGNKVAILLDVMPGEVFKGRVRSVGTGIGAGSPPQPGTLPQVENSRDWLRQSQRFPVAVEFEASELERLRGVRVGGQADVMIFTGDYPILNWLGRLYMGVLSYFSYLY
ncbi:MAG: HlyD family secretion protein [Ramlibacter sp.]